MAGGFEHERKYLVRRRPPGLAAWPRERIEQGYLAVGPHEVAGGRTHQEIRIRRTRRGSVLTLKRGAGPRRREVEVDLPAAAARALWPLTAGRRIVKDRYRVRTKDGVIEVDVYRGRHRGLIVAEVERGSLAQVRRFAHPAWLGREVTGERRYSNSELARR
jgi:CYTH domain-containing protein